jgi:outer membrane protein
MPGKSGCTHALARAASSVLLLVAAAFAPTASAETLEEALVQTYLENPFLISERAALRATDEQVPQALSNWRPTVQVSGSYGVRQIDSEVSGISNDTTNNPRDAELSVVQPLFRGFRTVAETSRARNRVASSRASLLSSEQRILLDAVTSYTDVVQAQVVVRLRESNVRVIQRQLEATNDRFRVGELTRTDVAQAESRLAQAEAELVRAKGELESAKARYRDVIGSEPDALVVPVVPAGLPETENDSRARAVDNNPDVIRADFNERAARDDIELAAGQLWPELSLTGSVGTDKDVSSANVERTTTELLANLRVPLYQAGDVSSQVRQAKQIASQQLSLLADARREAERVATAAWASLDAARASIASFESEVRAQEVAFEGVQQEANVGSRTVLDVLDAEQELLNARVNLVGARRDEIVSAYSLLSSIGRLTAQDLGLPVDYYDPTRKFNEVENKIYGTDISPQ